eukprot:m.195306 g.195306  ORF g.195306 m.195306 type:complete len:251 (-) comp15688_c0_seq7:2747-3499(-)
MTDKNADILLGVLTGISYVSGLDYYKGINKRYMEIAGTKHLIAPNPPMLMSSVDCDIYAKNLTERKWDDISDHLMVGLDRLVQAGCNMIAIASNTGHIVYPAFKKKYSEVGILHIADVTARALKAKGISTVGLLGTEPTMREAYLKDRLALHGIKTIVPSNEEDLSQIFQYIMDELGYNVFKDSTREYFLDQVEALKSRGAQGVILGCTEIELLINQKHTTTPVFPSAELHLNAITDILLGKATLKEFQP